MPPRSRTTDRSITTCRPCEERYVVIEVGRIVTNAERAVHWYMPSPKTPQDNSLVKESDQCVYEDQAPGRTREYQFVGVPQSSKDQPALSSAIWTALQEDVAQLNELLLSRPISRGTSPMYDPSRSEQLVCKTLDAEASASIADQIAFDPILDVMASPSHIDWSYIDEVINNMQDPSHHEHPSG
ncbi:hypothetical protein AC579_9486 [Pseudocercospora musae]|uniref:Uncharacterized protein n=1 Tax=Pseudocercospora musae TaxID=113226 RepID=A0A139HBP2_9PEZI|nr:hypothetical protein AC579_9486 [Pseudocercospora musae]